MYCPCPDCGCELRCVSDHGPGVVCPGCGRPDLPAPIREVQAGKLDVARPRPAQLVASAVHEIHRLKAERDRALADARQLRLDLHRASAELVGLRQECVRLRVRLGHRMPQAG